MNAPTRDGKRNRRKHNSRSRHKKKRAVAKHDGCLISHLIADCPLAALPNGLSKRGISVDDLPDELVAMVLAFLPCIDLCRDVARVCKRWRAITHDSASLGKALCAGAAAREAFLHGPLMTERVGGFGGCLLKDSLQWTRRNRPRAALARMLAAASGHVDCMARLDDHPWYDGACLVPAAVHGHLDVIKYAHENGCPWHYGVCSAAEAYGQVDCLRYAHGAGCYWRGECDEAAGNGHTDVLRYAKEKGLGRGEFACHYAAAGGHVDTLRYACENGWETCSATPTYAARRGHLDVLKYVHESGGDWECDTVWGAASGGHIDCLDYLLKNGCPGFDEGACDEAANAGRIATLQWLRAHGCPWGASVCAEAARGGHVDVLDWLRRNGCPWDRHTVRGAALRGHLNCLAYAIDNGCPFEDGDDMHDVVAADVADRLAALFG
ncbi:Ankyrin repeat domain containing protein [Pandoravirus macleodensis]|uniref:Ankyrin repeat domain containing protein n=1 Tax=Pandoravirus macleodensis TaxID=2107707 RepID=A0A2U7UDY7_9VIRU|nr:Ankyrin repeat domain containing protein [Pandoravirus macleodensis]AVK76689.1 Ankyrin repeat domain containing protein [Pandoravirus macleodensis]